MLRVESLEQEIGSHHVGIEGERSPIGPHRPFLRIINPGIENDAIESERFDLLRQSGDRIGNALIIEKEAYVWGGNLLEDLCLGFGGLLAIAAGDDHPRAFIKESKGGLKADS